MKDGHRFSLSCLGFLVASFLFITQCAAPKPVKVTLQWEPSPGATGYKVYYHHPNERPKKYIEVHNTGAEMAVHPNETWCFSVKAYNKGGESTFSETVCKDIEAPKSNNPEELLRAR